MVLTTVMILGVTRMDEERIGRAVRRSVAHLDYDRPFVAPARRPPRGRAFAAVASVAVLVAGVVALSMSLGGGGQASADTPPPLEFDPVDMSLTEVLDLAASAASAAPDQRPANGSYRYSVGEAWYVEEDPSGTRRIVSAVMENWIGSDGFGRREERVGHEIEAGRIVHDDVPDFDVEPYAVYDDVPLVDMAFELVPEDPAARVGADDLGISPFAADRDAAAFERMTTLLAAAPLSPVQRGVLWSSLGDLGRVELLGITTDRHGRQAFGIARPSSLGGLESENIVLIDPGTGEILGGESIYIGPSSPVDGAQPALTNFVVYIASVIVENPGDRP